MQEEIWKAVPSLPGVMASSLGRIKLPPRVVKMPRGGVRRYQPGPVTGSICYGRKGGSYQFRNLWSRQFGNIKVHQAVCEAFHGPAPAGMVTIHKNENALDNRQENLRWGTQKENMNAPGFIAYCRSRTGENSPVIKARRAREAAHAT